MRALSIRQPYVELILRGIKTVEYRTRPTRIVGERFYLYASKGVVRPAGRQVWSRDLATPDEHCPNWMIELAEQIRMIPPGTLLPTGVIVGTAVIDRVVDGKDGFFHWHLADARRIDRHRKPTRHPQPTWFQPFEQGGRAAAVADGE
ncbi:MAG: ASCH domain-containing protein [Tepidisphaeraceae bacterium]